MPVKRFIERVFIQSVRPGEVQGDDAENLTRAIKDVLRDAIEAGGSTLKDYKHTDGDLGYFQHRFSVYDREGQTCSECDCDISVGAGVNRIVQSGRSTFLLPGKAGALMTKYILILIAVLLFPLQGFCERLFFNIARCSPDEWAGRAGGSGAQLRYAAWPCHRGLCSFRRGGFLRALFSYYSQSLPQFGWTRIASQVFSRGGEKMILDFELSEGQQLLPYSGCPRVKSFYPQCVSVFLPKNGGYFLTMAVLERVYPTDHSNLKTRRLLGRLLLGIKKTWQIISQQRKEFVAMRRPCRS